MKQIYYIITLTLLCSFSKATSQNDSIYPKYKLIGMVTDEKKHIPLDSVKVTYVNKDKSIFKIFYTDKNGYYIDSIENRKIGEKLEWDVTCVKKGYITRVEKQSITFDTSINILINSQLQKMDRVTCPQSTIEKTGPFYFDKNKWQIRPDAASELYKLTSFMKETPSIIIELRAHTDCRGSEYDNIILSEKRAKSVVQYLINHGIDKSRLSSQCFGESKLLNDCDCKTKSTCLEEEHQKNNRVEFVIVKF